MASYNKNFVVKNGIEVADSLIFATGDTNKVGIGTSVPLKTLQVNGDAQVNDLTANDIFIQDATISGTISAGDTTGTSTQVLYSTGTGVTWSSIPVGISSISFKGNGSDVGISSIVNFVGSGITYSNTGAGVSFIFNYNRSDINPYIIYVSDYGAVGDGVTDDTTAIQSAVSAASTTDIPCVIRLLEKHVITSTISVSSSSITIEGAGSDMDHDVGSQGTGAKTQLIWQGSAGGIMVSFESPSGASAQKKYGGGLRNIFFEADDLAAIGLLIRSWNGAKFENLHFNNPNVVGIDLGVISGSLGEAKDSQDNRFIKCSSRHLETTGGTGGLLKCGGASGSNNASMNYFELMRCKIENGDAFILNNCDNNVFVRCNVTRLSGGTGNAVVCNGSNTPEDHARGNIFIHLSATEPSTFNPVPIVCKGTSSFTYPSEDNNFLYLDTDNVTPIPTIEAGATAYYTTIAGYTGKNSVSNLAIGATFGDAGYALTSIASTESLYISNRDQNHIVFDNRDGDKWIVGVDTNGNFKIVPREGGKNYGFNTISVPEYAHDAAASSGGVEIGGLYRRGSVLKLRIGSDTNGANTYDEVNFGSGQLGKDDPRFISTSVGLRIVYEDVLGTSPQPVNKVDYAAGISTDVLWYSIPQANPTYSFKWYGGETNLATLTADNLYNSGQLTLEGDVSKITAKQLVSNIGLGTAPISVASSTQVDGLNVEYLNGYVSAATTTPDTIVRRDSSNNINGNVSHLIHNVDGAQRGEWYADIPSRLGYTPFNKAGDVCSGIATFSDNVIVEGLSTLKQVSDVYSSVSTSSGTLTCDFRNGPIARTTSTDTSVINITNVPTTSGRALNYSVLINASSPVSELGSIDFRINGTSLSSGGNSIRWLNSLPPEGSTSGYYFIGLTILRVSSVWEVIAVFATYS
jgi:hypothetical protein